MEIPTAATTQLREVASVGGRSGKYGSSGSASRSSSVLVKMPRASDGCIALK